MAKPTRAAKSTPIDQHLSRLVIETMTSRRLAVFRASNYALWIETYGQTVADKVFKTCSKHWSDKGLPGVPFHPLLVSLFRTEGEKKCPSTSAK